MYVIIWQYTVRAGNEEEFERVYGTDGAWVSFFRAGDGYLGTALYRRSVDERGYITIDRWQCRDLYERFREANLAEYERIDRRCAVLTEREEMIADGIAVDG